ncbi:MAG: hypothetical protein HOP07_12320 [Bacteriovoracaceae bacterium]|nr:hypothetical protein [Bacteriovoracaceae bacterium]
MLKYFAKVFLISILSGSLLFMDIGIKGIQLQSALAAQSSGESHDRSSTTTVKTNAIDDSNMMATLTMSAVGLLASRLYTYKMTTDIMLAAAGGAVFLAGDILAFFKLKSVMKDMETQITRDKKGNINREQIAALERLKKSYEEAKKTAGTKKMLQMAAAAAFAAAAVMAYTMAGVETAQLTACTSTIPTVISAASASITSCMAMTYGAAACAAPFKACISSATPLSSSIAAYELKKQASGPSGPALAAYTASNSTLAAQVATTAGTCSMSGGAAIASACNTKLSTDIIDASGGAVLTFASTNPIIKKIINDSKSNLILTENSFKKVKPLQNIFNKTLDFFFSKANAALFSAMGIASSAAIAFLMHTQASLGPSIDIFMLIPQNRAIVWGVLAGLTFAASSATDNVISQIDANIAKIDMILNSMNSMALGATATQPRLTNPKNAVANKANNILKMNTAQYEDVDLSEAGGGQLPCFTGPDPKNCKSLDSTASGLPGNNLLDKNSQTQLTAILKTANGFNGTSKISKGTLDSAGKLASNAVAYRAAADRAKKLAQDRLKASGSKIDLDAESKKFSNQMEKAINEGLKKSNSTASSMTASMYGGGGTGALNATTADSKESNEKVGAESGANVAAVVPGTIDMSASGNAMAVDLGGGASLETNKESTPEELAAYNAATKGATSIDEFEIKNDITKDTSSSLFELISNRYQRSGYQRLFKLKEAAEVPVSK